MARIGIDIGGTFTDLCAMADDGSCWTAKLLTTPGDPSQGFMRILERAFEQGTGLRDSAAVRELVHATTVATNAILENRTARMGLITTAGFRDVLEIGRHFRRDIYNLFLEKPPVLIPRQRRLEVRQRMAADGSVLTPLDAEEARAAIAQLVEQGVEVIVVGFLHSYANAEHEEQVVELARAMTGNTVPVLASHKVCAEYREYERLSTAAVHGSVMPMVRKYLSNIESSLRSAKVTAPLSVMQSNGGMCAAGLVMEQPGLLMESGPAAGVIAAVEVGRRLGLRDLISFDMGGTTAKATLVRDGQVTINNDYEVGGGIQGGFGTGYPIRMPVVDLMEIGTGGGSVAMVDEAGQLRVGPRSAGAEPGPACYGRGGREPTITDANAVLGRLSPKYFAGGQFELDVEAARRAIDERVAQPLHMSIERAAEGIAALANAQMVRALQLVSVERGHDPRTCVMVAFGGAGPMHAAELARELHCPRVVIPPEAGVQSAWGLLVADARRDFSQTILGLQPNKHLGELKRLFEAMAGRGTDELIQAGYEPARIESRLAVDVRYAGQAYEVTVEMPRRAEFDAAVVRRINELFHEQHQRLYGHSDNSAAVHWVTLRAVVTGPVVRPAVRQPAKPTQPLQRRRMGVQRMIWSGRAADAPVYRRGDLGAGDRFTGPALVVQDDASLALPPMAAMEVADTGDILLNMEPYG